MKIKRRDTNGFEYSIFGIDLFIKYIIKLIKSKKCQKKEIIFLAFSLYFFLFCGIINLFWFLSSVGRATDS